MTQSMMTTLTILLTLWTLKCVAKNEEKPDVLLNFTELTEKYQHAAEKNDVVTEDGYILKLFHIPGEKNKTNAPVFIMHGLGDSSDSYVLRGFKSLAITLANEGYDVWLGNNRGNKYSRRHMHLNPDEDKEFWQFSFHEIGIFDLPAMIDFILEETNAEKLNVIAHSQGTTAFFALLATKEEYNEKVNVLTALGPVAFVADLHPPISTIAFAGPLINQFLLSIGVEEIGANETAAKDLRMRLCSRGLIGKNICRFGILFAVFGLDPERIEASFTPSALAHFPAGLSRKCLLHYDQLYFSQRFALYDYGSLWNLVKYKSLSPPNYDLEKISTKIALFVGRNDPFSNIRDVEHLKDLLPNVVSYTIMPPPLWTHIDFAWANDLDVSLFPYIFDILERHL